MSTNSWWNQTATEGDTFTGVVIEIDAIDTKWGTKTTTRIKTETGDVISLMIMGTVLESEWKEADPQEGDTVTVSHNGERISANKRPYKVIYVDVVQRAEETEHSWLYVSDQDGPGEDEQPESEPAPLSPVYQEPAPRPAPKRSHTELANEAISRYRQRRKAPPNYTPEPLARMKPIAPVVDTEPDPFDWGDQETMPEIPKDLDAQQDATPLREAIRRRAFSDTAA